MQNDSMKDPRDSDLSQHHKQFFEEVYPNPCSSKGQKAAPIGLFRKLHVSTSYSGFDCPANRNNNKSLQLNNPSRNPSHVSGFAGSGSIGSFGSFGRFLWLPSCFVTRCSSARSASCLSCGACQAGQKLELVSHANRRSTLESQLFVLGNLVLNRLSLMGLSGVRLRAAVFTCRWSLDHRQIHVQGVM